MTVRIAPSILAADFARLGEQVRCVDQAGADFIHVDVMDGHFVPNISMGPLVLEALARVTTLPPDVHLMITDPDRYIDVFISKGAKRVTVHAEAATHLHRSLTRIRDLKAKAGVAINPSTPVDAISEVTAHLDHVLVMSVNPGFGGQEFIAESYSKIARVRELLTAAGSQADIEVDGGVDETNAARLVAAGATILVAGAAIFRDPDPAAALRALRQAAMSGL